jgi:hypothetical protein
MEELQALDGSRKVARDVMSDPKNLNMRNIVTATPTGDKTRDEATATAAAQAIPRTVNRLMIVGDAKSASVRRAVEKLVRDGHSLDQINVVPKFTPAVAANQRGGYILNLQEAGSTTKLAGKTGVAGSGTGGSTAGGHQTAGRGSGSAAGGGQPGGVEVDLSRGRNVRSDWPVRTWFGLAQATPLPATGSAARDEKKTPK